MINNDNNLFFLAKDSQTASTRDGRRRCCFQSHQSPRQFPVDCFFFVSSVLLNRTTLESSPLSLVCHLSLYSLFNSIQSLNILSLSLLLPSFAPPRPHPAATYYTHPLPPPCFCLNPFFLLQIPDFLSRSCA